MIRHKSQSMAKYGKPEEDNYLCNPVPYPDENKLFYLWDVVNCKKCLKKRGKE